MLLGGADTGDNTYGRNSFRDGRRTTETEHSLVLIILEIWRLRRNWRIVSKSGLQGLNAICQVKTRMEEAEGSRLCY